LVVITGPLPCCDWQNVFSGARPVSGVIRPESARPGTMEQALQTPRTARTARPVTAAAGRKIRLGTASMLTEPDGPFIETSRLNMPKYAKGKSAKPLFEYLYYHEHDVERVRTYQPNRGCHGGSTKCVMFFRDL